MVHCSVEAVTYRREMQQDSPEAGQDRRRDGVSVGEQVLGALLEAIHLTAPHEVPGLVAEHAAVLGAQDAVIYLVDLQQQMLVPFVGSAEPDFERSLEPLAVESTLAGRAFQHLEIMTQPTPGDGHLTRVWLPLLDGTERLGVLAVTVNGAGALEDDDGLLRVRLRQFTALVAEIVVTKTFYGDAIVKARRRAQIGLAAEMQWGLLPPLTFASKEVVVAAALEPAYSVAGDSVDYAVDAGRGRFAVFDGMGHGLQSAQLAALSVAAYRNARRNDRTLTETAHLIDAAVQDAFDGKAFTTAVLAELDTDSGMLSWVSAGHHAPLLLREGRLVKALRTDPGLPFGMGLSAEPAFYPVGNEQLEPGDQLLFYTDGITEARSPDGEFFGVERLTALLERNYDQLPAPEMMRRVTRDLLKHQQSQLTDDATMLLVEWRPGTAHRLLPT